jgi:hypothetical protein
MSDNDQLTDNVELRELRESLTGIAMPQRPTLETITARGRARRRHRRSMVTRLSGTGVVGIAAATLGVTGAFTASSTLNTIRTPSFTLVSYTDGTAKLTLNPGELLNPTELQSDFAKHGIPAKVTTGSYCTSDPAPSGFSEAVTGPGPGTWKAGSVPQPIPRPTITIDPSKIPAGTELSVGDFNLPTGAQQANFSLINSNSYTCSSTPPDMTKPDTSTEALGLLYDGPVSPKP